MHYDKFVQLSVVMVIDTGGRRPALLLVSIPDTAKALRADINQAFDSVKVL